MFLLAWSLAGATSPPPPSSAPVKRVPSATLQERPLYALRHACNDRRYPRLAGHWAVGCSPGGQVDLAMDVESGTLVTLEAATDSPGVGEGALFAPGSGQGMWILPSPIPTGNQVTVNLAPLAPAATDGRHAALALAQRVTVYTTGDSTLALHDAEPVPWYPPALAWPVVAWVDGRDRATTGTDLWMLDVEAGGAALPLEQALGDQRHVTGDGHHLAWVDDSGLHILDLEDGRRQFYLADTGFRAGVSLWGEVACWEDRGSGDIDILCSDGVAIQRPGDQGWPSRWGQWLLFREGDQVRLAQVTMSAGPAGIPLSSPP